MNFEQYLKTRNELMAEAEQLMKDGKLEDSESKMKEVKDLDNKWEEIKVANANFNALKDNDNVTDIENKTEEITGGVTVDNIKESVKDEVALYESAWAKNLM